MFLLHFPLMLIPLAIYNAIVFYRTDVQLDGIVLQMNMMSGAVFSLTVGHSLILISLAFLFIEVLKASRIGAATILDHLLSTLVLIAFIIEFLLVERAATATFFILMAIAFVDVIAGYSVSIRSAVRDFTFDR